jgi:hypothetical protein
MRYGCCNAELARILQTLLDRKAGEQNGDVRRGLAIAIYEIQREAK